MHQTNLHPPRLVDEVRAIFATHLGRIIAGEVTAPVETAVLRSDGTEIPVEIVANAMPFGGTLHILGSFRDISQRVRAEESLRESEERFRMVSQLTIDYVFRLSVSEAGEVRMDFVSDNYSDLTGRELGEADTVEKWASFFHHEDLPKAMVALKSILATRQPVVLECRTFKKDGSPSWVSVTAQPAWDERKGRVVAIIGAVKDINERKRAETLVKDTLAFDQMILNTASIGILTYKASGACVSVNPAAAFVTGGKVEELLAQNFRQIDSWKRSGLLQSAEEALASGAEVRRDVHVVTTFGKEVWYHARFLSFEALGERYLLLMISDITERKRAEDKLRESEEKFRTLTETVDVGIFHSLLDGTFLHANSAIARIAGYESVEEFMRLKTSDLYANPADRQEVIAELLASGHVKEREIISTRKDGSACWGSFSAVLMRNQTGDPVAVLGTIIDITKRREAVEERIRLLKREQAARLEAEAALRNRDEFLTIGAHELKTPLAALKIHIEGMQKRLERAEEPTGDPRTGLDVAARQVQRLVRLVTALLDITRIRTGRLEIYREACDIAVLTQEVLSRNRAAFHQAGCETSYDGPESIMGVWDSDRLEQVLENLLGNAMKFARGTRIEVRCDRLPATVRITIRDRGTGIPASDLERIFEPYERGGGELHFGGLGMGLYIAREIIREHGGSIRAENVEDGGSLFTIELPRE